MGGNLVSSISTSDSVRTTPPPALRFAHLRESPAPTRSAIKMTPAETPPAMADLLLLGFLEPEDAAEEELEEGSEKEDGRVVEEARIVVDISCPVRSLAYFSSTTQELSSLP